MESIKSIEPTFDDGIFSMSKFDFTSYAAQTSEFY